MDPELKRMLEENRAIEKDNNSMLRAIRHHQWLGSLSTIVFWLVILITPFYLYQHYVQPMVAKFSATPGATSSSVFHLPTSADIEKLINSFKAGK